MKAERITRFDATQQGSPSTRIIEWLQTESGDVVQHMVKNEKSTHAIKYSPEKFDKLFESVLATKHDIGTGQQDGFDVLPIPDNFGEEAKKQLLNRLVSAMKPSAVQEVVDDPDREGVKQLVEAVRMQRYSMTVEKTKEQIVDVIYQNFGSDCFFSKDFREVYNSVYEKGKPHQSLKRLRDKDFIVRDKVDDDVETPNNRTEYIYKLSDQALDKINKHGKMAHPDNPSFSNKRAMIQEA